MQSTLKENRGNNKKISFQFHYGKFSQQKYSTHSYYYRRVTRGRKGEISPGLSRKLEKSFLISRKSAQIVAIYWLSFSCRMHLLSFSRTKTPKLFHAGPVFLALQMNEFLCPGKFLVKFAKFYRTMFLIEHHQWLHLHRAH